MTREEVLAQVDPRYFPYFSRLDDARKIEIVDHLIHCRDTGERVRFNHITPTAVTSLRLDLWRLADLIGAPRVKRKKKVCPPRASIRRSLPGQAELPFDQPQLPQSTSVYVSPSGITG